jgi:hypothetical protein
VFRHLGVAMECRNGRYSGNGAGVIGLGTGGAGECVIGAPTAGDGRSTNILGARWRPLCQLHFWRNSSLPCRR